MELEGAIFCPNCEFSNLPGRGRCQGCQIKLAPHICVRCDVAVSPGVEVCDRCAKESTERVEFADPCPVCGLCNPRGRPSCLGCGAPVVELEERTLASGRRPSPRDLSGQSEELMPTDPPFVGRAEERATLSEAIDRALGDPRTGLVVVSGAGGIGKTRLIQDALRRQQALRGGVRLFAATVREGADGPFSPFSRILLDRFGVTPSRGPAAVRGTMSTEVGRLLGGGDAAQVAEVTHLLGHVAGVPFPDSPILRALEGDPRRLAARTRHALRTFFEADARIGGPLILLLDKFNQAGREAIGLLGEIVAHSDPIPLCVLVAGRPPVTEMLDDVVAAAEDNGPTGRVTVLRLGPLREGEARQYLQALLPKLATVPEELVAATWHRSEGNPVSLRALARVCLEAGVIDPRGSSWTVHLERLRDGSLPVSMEDAHRARMARLSAEERRVMERAALFGEVFWEEGLLALSRADVLDARDRPSSDPAAAEPATAAQSDRSVGWSDLDARDLHDLLRRLEAAEFITVFEQGEFPHTVEYMFRHAGLRNLLMQEMPDELRRVLHLRAAQWLENASGSRREQYLAAIGQHYERGGEPRKAAFAVLHAAGLARRSYHNEHAISLYRKGLELAAPEDRNARVEAHHDLGSVLFLIGDYDGAEQEFRRMLEHAWVLCHRGKAGAALNRIGRVHRARGDLTQARACLERALVLFRTVEDTRGIASTLDDLGNLAAVEGAYDTALSRSAEALELRRALGDRRGTAVSLQTIGTIETAKGLWCEAEACFREALQIRREVDDDEGVATTLNALGVLSAERDDLDAALALWSEALEVARTVGARRIVASVLNNIGEAELASGRDDAAGHLADALTIAEELEDKRLITDVRRNLGRVHLRRNEIERARGELEQAVSVAEELGGKHAIGLAILALAELHATTLWDEAPGPQTAAAGADDDDDDELPAEPLFRRALSIFEDIRNETETAKCLSSYGTYLVERGEPSHGKLLLERAAALFRRLGSRSGERIEQTIQEI